MHGVRGREREGKDDVKRYREKTAISKARRETGSTSFPHGSEGTSPANTLVLWEKEAKPPSLWYLVSTALGN